MGYPYIIPDIFQSQLDALDGQRKRIVIEKINFIIKNPRHQQTQRVINLEGAEFRECHASGDYRIFYGIEDLKIKFLILFLTVTHIKGHKIYDKQHLNEVKNIYKKVKEKNLLPFEGSFIQAILA